MTPRQPPLEPMMETTLNYQVNYGPRAKPVPVPRIDPAAPTFASVDGAVASLSSHECIFLTKRGSEPHVMTFQVLQALDQCREFRSLDEHMARIQSTIPGLAGKSDDIRRVLDSLIQRRLLVADSAFIESLRSAPRTLAPLRAVFIRACDSPGELQQLVKSLVDYERRYRGNRHYVLLDDSTLAEHINEHRDQLREFARTTGCKVSYVGRAERTRLLEKITKAVPHGKAVLPRLLAREAQSDASRFGGGRGHNLALLLGAGARFAQLDDDMRLPLRVADFARPGLDPNPASHIAVRFYGNAEEVCAAGSELERDVFDLHLEACGQALGSLGAYPIERAALRGLNLGRLDLFSDRTRVVATHHGHYGSSGASGAAWLYDLDAEDRAEFWRDRANYLHNSEARHIWFGVRQARAVALAGFSAFMIDATETLPCTSPTGRGEDVLFSSLTRFCHPDGVALELPEAIGHLQENVRTRTAKTGTAPPPALNQFLYEFTQRQFGQCKAAEPAQRVCYLADMFRDLAGASRRDRIAHLREYLSYTRADLIDRLQHQLDAAADAPVYWQADVRSIIQSNAQALLAKAPPRLAEWPEDLDENGCADALTTELTQMADALEIWPDAWRYAADQGEKLLGGL
jgi:hypothetical protein